MLALPIFLPPSPPAVLIVRRDGSGSVLRSATGDRPGPAVPTLAPSVQSVEVAQIRADGTLVGVGGERIVLLGKDGTLAESHRFTPWGISPYDGGISPSVALSPDGTRFAVGFDEGLVIADRGTATIVRRIRIGDLAKRFLFRTGGWVTTNTVFWRGDGREVAFSAAFGSGDGSSDGSVRPTTLALDVTSGAVRKIAEGYPQGYVGSDLLLARWIEISDGHDGRLGIDAFLIAPDGRRRVVARRTFGVCVSRGRIVALTESRSWTMPGAVRIPGKLRDVPVQGLVGVE